MKIIKNGLILLWVIFFYLSTSSFASPPVKLIHIQFENLNGDYKRTLNSVQSFKYLPNEDILVLFNDGLVQVYDSKIGQWGKEFATQLNFNNFCNIRDSVLIGESAVYCNIIQIDYLNDSEDITLYALGKDIKKWVKPYYSFFAYNKFKFHNEGAYFFNYNKENELVTTISKLPYPDYPFRSHYSNPGQVLIAKCFQDKSEKEDFTCLLIKRLKDNDFKILKLNIPLQNQDGLLQKTHVLNCNTLGTHLILKAFYYSEISGMNIKFFSCDLVDANDNLKGNCIEIDPDNGFSNLSDGETENELIIFKKYFHVYNENAINFEDCLINLHVDTDSFQRRSSGCFTNDKNHLLNSCQNASSLLAQKGAPIAYDAKGNVYFYNNQKESIKNILLKLNPNLNRNQIKNASIQLMTILHNKLIIKVRTYENFFFIVYTL